MQGASRRSLDTLRAGLSATGPAAEVLSSELLSVSGLLGREGGLRAALTDPGVPGLQRADLARTLLGGRISESTVDVVAHAAEQSWSAPRDLGASLEILGATVAFAAAESAGTLDAIEDELFRFGRTVHAQTQLRGVLDDASVPADAKVGVARSLLAGKVTPTTLVLVEHLLRHDRSRRFTTGLDEFGALAAQRHQELVAEVTVAAPMQPEQEQQLASTLGRLHARDRVRLQVVVDPTVLGGAVVRVGDEVYDGSVTHRLEQARAQFTG